MMETEIDPIASLKDRMKNLTPDQAVKVARELCSQLDGGADSFHGGIYPENIRIDDDGRAILGTGQDVPASDRTADQVEYLAPEYFWDNAGSAAADVYSIGLLLYAGCNGGYLPFQPKGGALTDRDRSAALRKRMKGETVGMPKKMAPALKAILRKALAYDPGKRYATASELLAALNETGEAQPAAQDTLAAGAVTGAAAAATDAVADADVQETVAAELPTEEAVTAEETTPEETSAEDASDTNAELAGDNNEAEQADGETTILGDAETTVLEQADGETTVLEQVDGETVVLGQADAVSQESAEEPAAKYRVQKDFEQQGRRAQKAASVPYGGRTRRRTSPAITIASIVAAAVIVTAILVVVFGGNGSKQQTSQLYTADTAETAASPTPLIITPAPNNLTEEDVEETSTPVPTAEATPASTVEPDEDAEDGDDSTSGGNSSSSSANSSIIGGSDSSESSSGNSSSSSSSGSSSSSSGSGSGSGSSSSGSSSSYSVTETNDTVYVQATDVNVRTGPSTEYRVIGSVNTGDELQRTGTSGSWSRVTYNGETGFVFSSYLTTTAPTATPAPTETPAATETPVATATPVPTATPAPTATPVVSDYTVTLTDQTLVAAKEALTDSSEMLAVITSQADLDDITEALNATDAQYAWLGAEKDEDGQWYWVSGETKTAFTDDDNTHWANDAAMDGDCFLLIRQSNDEWKYSSVNSADFDVTSYTGKLATVTQAVTAEPDAV